MQTYIYVFYVSAWTSELYLAEDPTAHWYGNGISAIPAGEPI